MPRRRVVAFATITMTLALAIPMARIVGEDATDESAVVAFKDIGNDPHKLEIERVCQLKILQGFPDGTFRPSDTVTERQFGTIVERMLAVCPNFVKPELDQKNPNQAMTRIRAFTIIVRAASDKSALSLITDPKRLLSSFKDYDQIPAWAAKHAALAVDRGYVDVEPSFRPMAPITRSELAKVLARCLPSVGSTSEGTGYTGLVVDCRGLSMKRSMCPKIVSEDGTQIYPDPHHLPTLDFIEDNGLVAYVTDIADSKRTGSRPLEVKAASLKGVASDIVVISDSDRDLILSEEKTGRFLANWNVTLQIDAKQE